MTHGLAFAHLTDHHLLADEAATAYNCQPTLRLHQVLDDIGQRWAGQIDFILSTGDVAENAAAAEYATARSVFELGAPAAWPGPLTIEHGPLSGLPFYVFPGNHDGPSPFAPAFFGTTAPARPAHAQFTRGGIHFVFLDFGWDSRPRVDAQLLEFAARALPAEASRPALLITHHHLAPAEDPDPFVQPAELTPFWALIADRPVLGIVCGHSHHTFEAWPAGLPLFSLGATARQLVFNPVVQPAAGGPVYQIVTVDARGISRQIIRLD